VTIVPAQATDLTGRAFDRLVVVKLFCLDKNNKCVWACRCSCGKTKNILANSLVSGKTKSCGCFQKEQARKLSTTHGMRGHPLYTTWALMKSRCNKKNNADYGNYGERGVSVCREWKDFSVFVKDVGERPNGTSLDRIDNDGNYCPENVRWATQKQQCRNSRSNRMLTFNGETMCVAEWAEKLGVSSGLIYDRLNKLGWSTKRALQEERR